mmetsp:Transcript_34534/g.90457  ORF Transcript_34534/g.90457 Transcript_34534/m.90457 type:complete len:263 (+) Transcript_34534:1568-2356(+)
MANAKATDSVPGAGGSAPTKASAVVAWYFCFMALPSEASALASFCNASVGSVTTSCLMKATAHATRTKSRHPQKIPRASTASQPPTSAPATPASTRLPACPGAAPADGGSDPIDGELPVTVMATRPHAMTHIRNRPLSTSTLIRFFFAVPASPSTPSAAAAGTSCRRRSFSASRSALLFSRCAMYSIPFWITLDLFICALPLLVASMTMKSGSRRRSSAILSLIELRYRRSIALCAVLRRCFSEATDVLEADTPVQTTLGVV